MIGEHAPLAIGVAPDIGSIEMKLVPARRLQADHRAKEMRAAIEQGSREQATAHQPLRPVNILEQHFHERRALDNGIGNARPFARVDHQRDGRQWPFSLVAVAGHAKPRADLVCLPLDACARLVEITIACHRNFIGHSGPHAAIACFADDIALRDLRAIGVKPRRAAERWQIGRGASQGQLALLSSPLSSLA